MIEVLWQSNRDELRPVNPLERPDWDAPLTRRPDFSFFHGASWTRVLSETYGYTPVWQAAGSALMPLMEVDSWLTGRRGVALPFTDECGPLCESAEEWKQMFQNALAWGRERGWKSIELRGGRKFSGEAPASLCFYGHRVDLAHGEAQLFESMDGSARQAVRKAEKDGVKAEVLQSEAAVRDFYDLQCLTRKRHGLPPQPWAFFLNIWRRIVSQRQGIIVLASRGGERIGGAVYFFLAGRAIYKYGASDFRWQQLRPNNLAMWEGMKWLSRNGCVSLDLGKTALANEGLRKFKLHLGAVEQRIEYLKYDIQKDRFMRESDPAEGWQNRVFRNLPVFISRWAGQLLYKHWA